MKNSTDHFGLIGIQTLEFVLRRPMHCPISQMNSECPGWVMCLGVGLCTKLVTLLQLELLFNVDSSNLME